MLEVEMKASLAGVSEKILQHALERAGFSPRQTMREIDIYFNSSTRDFKKTDEALRLRSCQDLSCGNAAQVFITYKGPKQDAVSSTRTEHETAVGSLPAMRSLLEALGYRAMFTVDKIRREFALENITLCLDTVEGLGDYLELEQLVEHEEEREPAVRELLGLLDTLGIPREQLTRKSYLELLYFS